MDATALALAAGATVTGAGEGVQYLQVGDVHLEKVVQAGMRSLQPAKPPPNKIPAYASTTTAAKVLIEPSSGYSVAQLPPWQSTR